MYQEFKFRTMLTNPQFRPQRCLGAVIDFGILAAPPHGHTESVPSFCFASRWCCPIRIAVDGTNKNSNRIAEGDYLCVLMLNVKCKITRRTLRPRDFGPIVLCKHTQVNIICKRRQEANNKAPVISAII